MKNSRRSVVAPFAAGSAVLAGQPRLIPSLGPTVFLQTEKPNDDGSRAYNIVVGHLVGLAAGLLAVWLFGAVGAPGVLDSDEVVASRVWASALAIALTLSGTALLNVSHPPAAATTLLVTLGGVKPTVSHVLAVLIGVLLMATLGKAARRALAQNDKPDAPLSSA